MIRSADEDVKVVLVSYVFDLVLVVCMFIHFSLQEDTSYKKLFAEEQIG